MQAGILELPYRILISIVKECEILPYITHFECNNVIIPNNELKFVTKFYNGGLPTSWIDNDSGNFRFLVGHDKIPLTQQGHKYPKVITYFHDVERKYHYVKLKSFYDDLKLKVVEVLEQNIKDQERVVNSIKKEFKESLGLTKTAKRIIKLKEQM